VLLIGAFVLVERRAAEPVLPLWVFHRRILVTSSLVGLGVGAVLIGLTSYVPTFVQGCASHHVFMAVVVLAVLMGLAVAAMPRRTATPVDADPADVSTPSHAT
jgi:hypothetical protein